MKSVKETILEVLNHKYFNGVKSLETIDNRKLLAKIEFEKIQKLIFLIMKKIVFLNILLI